MEPPGHDDDPLVGAGGHGHSIFKVSPAAVHFAGFTVGQTHSQPVEVTNISTRPQRLTMEAVNSKSFSPEYVRQTTARRCARSPLQLLLHTTHRDKLYVLPLSATDTAEDVATGLCAALGDQGTILESDVALVTAPTQYQRPLNQQLHIACVTCPASVQQALLRANVTVNDKEVWTTAKLVEVSLVAPELADLSAVSLALQRAAGVPCLACRFGRAPSSRGSRLVYVLLPREEYAEPCCDTDIYVRDSKKGTISPGMTQTLLVTFSARDWQYRNGAIHLHCSPAGARITVPLHAYPIMNTVVFPRRIDMGNTEVGGCIRKQIRLECKVPLSFEYQLTVINHNAQISVYPLSGVIPGHGSALVNVEYAPSRRATASATIEVNVSQFGFEPFVCTIVGSAIDPADPAKMRPTAYDMRSLATARTLRALTSRAEEAAKAPYRPPGASPRGSKGAARALQRHRKQQLQRTRGHTPPAPGMLTPLPVVDGVKVPPNLYTLRDVNFMLNQAPGRRTLKEMHALIAVEKTAKVQQSKALTQTLGPPGSSQRKVTNTRGHAMDFSDRPQADIHFAGKNDEIRALAFHKERSQYNRYEEMLHVNPTKQRIGQRLLAPKDIQALQSELAALAQQREVAVLTETLQRKQPLTEPVGRGRVIYRLNEQPVVPPRFDDARNDDWQLRRQRLAQFRGSVSKVLVRRRVQQRIELLKNRLLPKESSSAANSSSLAPVEFKLSRHTRRDLVRSVDLPLYTPPSKDTRTARAGAIPPVPVFSRTPNITSHAAPEWRVLGYHPHKRTQVGVAASSTLPSAAEPPAVGALEELQRRAPCGVSQVLPSTAMPSALLQPVGAPPLSLLHSGAVRPRAWPLVGGPDQPSTRLLASAHMQSLSPPPGVHAARRTVPERHLNALPPRFHTEHPLSTQSATVRSPQQLNLDAFDADRGRIPTAAAQRAAPLSKPRVEDNLSDSDSDEELFVPGQYVSSAYKPPIATMDLARTLFDDDSSSPPDDEQKALGTHSTAGAQQTVAQQREAVVETQRLAHKVTQSAAIPARIHTVNASTADLTLHTRTMLLPHGND